MKHTKGPWNVSILSIQGYQRAYQINPTNQQKRPVDEDLANAQLIAAAPEMLEVLKQLQRLEEGRPISHDLITEIDEVIRKAKGQE